MSLETAIAENTAAIRELIAKLSAGPAIPQAASSPADTKVADAPKAEKAAKAPEAVEEKPISYDTVKQLITNLVAAKGKEIAVKTLASLGVSKGPELKPEQYKDAVAALTKALEA